MFLDRFFRYNELRSLMIFKGLTGVSLVLLSSLSLLAAEPTLDDGEFCEILLDGARMASMGVIDNPLSKLRVRFGENINDPTISRGLHEFEDSVLELFELSPDLRNLRSFQERWRLSDNDALDVLTYYGTRIFYDDIRFAGNPEDVLQRLREVSLEYFIRSNHPTALRYEYYKSNFILKSVPEMAAELDLTQGQVYFDLMMLGLSRVEAFENLSENVAKAGPQSRRFINHHLHILNRNVSWERIVAFEGRRWQEVDVLVLLLQRGITHAAIANLLNQIQNLNPSHPDLRTERSVDSKLIELGLSRTNNLSSPEVYDPRYGYLKLHGNLVTPLVHFFLFENKDRPMAWQAQQLGVTENGLQKFMQRNHLSLHSELLARYLSQQEAIDVILDWTIKNERLPNSADFGDGPGKVHITLNRLFRNNLSQSSLFKSRNDVWLAIKRRSISRNIPIRLVDLRFPADAITAEIRAEWRHEAVGLILTWMSKNNWKWPDHEDFGEETEGKIPLVYLRLNGRGDYAVNAKNGTRAIFENGRQAIMAIYGESKRQGAPLMLVNAPLQSLDGITDEIRGIWQQEIIDATLNWLRQKFVEDPYYQLKLKDIITLPELNSVQVVRLNATTYYSPTGRSYALRIFNNSTELWLKLKKAGQQRNIHIRLLPVRLDELTRNEELISEIRDEFLTELMEWILLNKRFPSIRDYGHGAEQIKVDYRKVFGRAQYGENQPLANGRLYDFYEDAFTAITTRLNSDERFSPEFRQIINTEMAKFLSSKRI